MVHLNLRGVHLILIMLTSCELTYTQVQSPFISNPAGVMADDSIDRSITAPSGHSKLSNKWFDNCCK